MASGLRFYKKISELQEEINKRGDIAELFKREHFIAARKIQAWFRGIMTRKHLSILHKEAIIIQSNWRGYCVRNNLNTILIYKEHQMWEDYYNCMAIRIQAVWRGYLIRKTTLNLQERWRWLNNIYTKNEEIVEIMQKFKESEINYCRDIVEHESLLWVLFILFKSHHLLRTKIRPGVITHIDQINLTLIEKMLKCLKYQFYKPKKVNVCEHYKSEKKFSSILCGISLRKCEQEIKDFEFKLKTGNIPIHRNHSYAEEENLRNIVQSPRHELLQKFKKEKCRK